MEEKNLSPNESIRIISQMIEASKHRVAMVDTRISVMWAALSVITAAVVLVCCLLTGNPIYNVIWFAIPVIGIPLNISMARKSTQKRGSKTYLDRMSDQLWSVVGYLGIALTVMCIIFSLCGYSSVWVTMFFYAFIIVGFGAAMQGIILRENSYTIGGVISILMGFAMVGCMLCRIPLMIIWVIPVYIVCFILMFIVPAFVIRKKINRADR